MKTYEEDPPSETLPPRAARELGLTDVRCWLYERNTWVVSGWKDGRLRLFSPVGKTKWQELTVGKVIE